MLVRSGFHAVPFSSTADAIDGLEPGGVSLAIVDILMPDHDGIDAILALRRIDPKLRIIAMSGGGARMPSGLALATADRSEEHTSELQSLMRISYAVFCLKKKTYRM